MINSFEMLEVVVNDSDFNFPRKFELIRDFEELNRDKIGDDALMIREVVIGNSAENVKANGILVKKLECYDGMDTIKDTKICGQKADAIYALTNMSGKVYYFLAWYVVD